MHIEETEEVEDKDGNIKKYETDIVDTELLADGTVHRHEVEIT